MKRFFANAKNALSFMGNVNEGKLDTQKKGKSNDEFDFEFNLGKMIEQPLHKFYDDNSEDS